MAKTDSPPAFSQAHDRAPQAPTVGRVVHYTPPTMPGAVWPATVCKVHPDGSVNIGGFNTEGHTFAAQSIRPAPEGCVAGSHHASGLWCWPERVAPSPNEQPTPRPAPTSTPP